MEGAYDWKRRMGVHEAYHQRGPNRWIHWACIPVEIAAVVTLSSCVRVGPADPALVLIAASGWVYVRAEWLMGSTMSAALIGCWLLARSVEPTMWVAGGAVAAFAVAFAVQVGLGHRIEGRDDTDLNLAELRRTGNPIPILLVFYYHWVELFLAAGYRRALGDEIRGHRDAELARLAALDPSR